MLSKTNRIKDKKLFPLILKKGIKYYCPFFIFINATTIPNTRNSSVEITKENIKVVPRFGFITSKKVGAAVQRNTVRRIFSEIVRLEISKLQPTSIGIFIAHKNAVEAPYESLQKEIKEVLKKASLYI